jgi:NADH-quinone oxidoreductase subunit A
VKEIPVDLAWPIVGLGLLAFGFGAFSVIASAIIGPKKYNKAKLDAYECGIEATPQPMGGGKYPIRYYLTAMMFIIFDIEIMFLYPWAVNYGALGLFGLGAVGLFLLIVTLAYFYDWRRGGLEWD